MSVILKSGSSGYLADVDVNRNLKVTLPTDEAQAGYARTLDGLGNPIVTTESGALLTSLEAVMLFEQVDGAAVNTNVWSPASSNMTIAQASGFITLNSTLATTANAYAILTSIKAIPMYGPLPLRAQINAKVATIPQANQTMELGLGSVGTNAAPTDGAFFRWAPNGNFLAVVNNGGSETTSANLTPPPTANVMTLYEVIMVEDRVQFYINDEQVADIVNPVGLAFPTGAGRLPVFARAYNSASVPAQAPQISIGQVVVLQQDMQQQRPWSEVLATLGRGCYQSPVTPFGQTANHANSTSPASATLSNTAAGYTTLGGRYQFAAVAGAATDFALFAYQVPAGYQLLITNVRIAAVVTGAAVGLSGTVLDWSLGLNASAVSLATADGAGTWAPRRIPIGAQGLATAAGIGASAPDLINRFDPPLVVDAGRYLHVILQVPVGLATVSQVLRGDVFIGGYFE